jgi:NAD(P)-dependent dehydrogenase (short-subunit alcohol dehydrogenase family)
MTSPDILLTDQVAIVTGGANGLGASIAINFARSGADVVIADIDTDNANETAEAIRAHGRRALVVQTDVTDHEQVVAMVDQASTHFGRIDILVNNAGGTRQKSFMTQSERSWRRLIDLNLVSMLSATSAATEVMIRSGRGGTVINIASSEGLRAAPGYAVYAACKAGMISFTRSMSLELSEYGIRVFALAPDMIMTPGLKPFFDAATPAEADARARYIPLGRIGVPDEVGKVAAFLASDMASYLTGVTLPIDGGTIASSGWNRMPSGEWSLYHEFVQPAPGQKG